MKHGRDWETGDKPLSGNDASDNHDDLIVWLACKEAKALLAGPGTAGK